MGTCKIKEVKTRKSHLCNGCNKTIPAGSIAQSISGLASDGTAYSYYYCQKCVKAAEDDGSEGAYSEHLDIFM